MKAMILAAGLGTRLKPVTENIPKALVKVHGQAMLGIVIRKVMQAGIREIVINVHHRAEQVKEYLHQNHSFGAEIYISDETDCLLDTGGGLKKAAEQLQGTEPVLVHNVDILSNIDLRALVNAHILARDGRLATLAVNNRETNRVFLVNESNDLCGWMNKTNGDIRWARKQAGFFQVSFACIHVVSQEFIQRISETGVFSIIDAYLRLAAENCIKVQPVSEYNWIDVGTVQNLQRAEEMFSQKDL